MKASIILATIVSLFAASVAADECRDACKGVYENCTAQGGTHDYCQSLQGEFFFLSLSLSLFFPSFLCYLFLSHCTCSCHIVGRCFLEGIGSGGGDVATKPQREIKRTREEEEEEERKTLLPSYLT